MLKIDKKSKDQIVAEDDVEGFREELGPFVVAAETTRMAMVFTNANRAHRNRSHLRYQSFSDETASPLGNVVREH